MLSREGMKDRTPAVVALDNEVDAKPPFAKRTRSQRKEAASWRFDARHFHGGYMRWSEVSAVEDDADRMRCLHFSRRLCSKVREEWGKCRVGEDAFKIYLRYDTKIL